MFHDGGRFRDTSTYYALCRAALELARENKLVMMRVHTRTHLMSKER